MNQRNKKLYRERASSFWKSRKIFITCWFHFHKYKSETSVVFFLKIDSKSLVQFLSPILGLVLKQIQFAEMVFQLPYCTVKPKVCTFTNAGHFFRGEIMDNYLEINSCAHWENKIVNSQCSWLITFLRAFYKKVAWHNLVYSEAGHTEHLLETGEASSIDVLLTWTSTITKYLHIVGKLGSSLCHWSSRNFRWSSTGAELKYINKGLGKT